MTFCKECGDKLIPGKQFCGGCGEKASSGSTSSVIVPQTSDQNIKTANWVSSGALALAFLSCSQPFVSTSGYIYEEVFSVFNFAIRDHNAPGLKFLSALLILAILGMLVFSLFKRPPVLILVLSMLTTYGFYFFGSTAKAISEKRVILDLGFYLIMLFLIVTIFANIHLISKGKAK